MRFYSNPSLENQIRKLSFCSSQNRTPHRRQNRERVLVRDRLERWPSAKNQRSLQGPAPVICWVFALASICREGAGSVIPGDPDRSSPASLRLLKPAACSLPPGAALPWPQFYRPAKPSPEPLPRVATPAGLRSFVNKESQSSPSCRASAPAEGARLGD